MHLLAWWITAMRRQGQFFGINTDVTFNEREYLKCTTYIHYNPMQENPKSAGYANVTI